MLCQIIALNMEAGKSTAWKSVLLQNVHVCLFVHHASCRVPISLGLYPLDLQGLDEILNVALPQVCKRRRVSGGQHNDRSEGVGPKRKVPVDRVVEDSDGIHPNYVPPRGVNDREEAGAVPSPLVGYHLDIVPDLASPNLSDVEETVGMDLEYGGV